jgi:hypothetical protein
MVPFCQKNIVLKSLYFVIMSNLTHFRCSVVNPDPVGSGTFCRIHTSDKRIRIREAQYHNLWILRIQNNGFSIEEEDNLNCGQSMLRQPSSMILIMKEQWRHRAIPKS